MSRITTGRANYDHLSIGQKKTEKKEKNQTLQTVSKVGASVGAGVTATTGALFAPEILVRTPKGEKITTLNELLDKGTKHWSGIEIESFAPIYPKNFDKKDVAEHLAREVYQKEYPGKFVGIKPVFHDADGAQKEVADKAEKIFEKMHQSFAEVKGSKPITRKEKEFFNKCVAEMGKSAENNDGLKIVVREKTGEKVKDLTLIVDQSLRPHERTYEAVTDILKDKKDYQVFARQVEAQKALEPKVGPFKKVSHFVKSTKTQLEFNFRKAKFAIETAKNYHREKPRYNNAVQNFFSNLNKRVKLATTAYFSNSEKTEKLIGMKLPGHLGLNNAISGSGSVHIHKNATQIIENNPAGLVNVININARWQDFLHNYIAPGASRQNYCKKTSMELVKDINESIAPKIQEAMKKGPLTKQQIMDFEDEIAIKVIKHCDTHEKLKYVGQNILNGLGQSFVRVKKKIESGDIKDLKFPKLLDGVIGAKALKKVTVEFRVMQSNLDPLKILKLDQLLDNMMSVAEQAGKSGKIISFETVKYKPHREKSLLKQMLSELSTPDNKLKFADWKNMKTPILDRKIWNDIMTANVQETLKPPGYNRVNLAGLRTTFNNLKEVAKDRIKLLKEPEVVAAIGLGGVVTAGALSLLSRLDNKKNTNMAK